MTVASSENAAADLSVLPQESPAIYQMQADIDAPDGNGQIALTLDASFHDGKLRSATTTRNVSARIFFNTISFSDASTVQTTAR